MKKVAAILTVLGLLTVAFAGPGVDGADVPTSEQLRVPANVCDKISDPENAEQKWERAENRFVKELSDTEKEAYLEMKKLMEQIRAEKEVFRAELANMTDAEKAANPTHITTGGYLKVHDYKSAFTKSVVNASKEERDLIRALPNFDDDVFFEISGCDLRLLDQDDVVVVNGKRYKLIEE